ncbi:hypothetical protein J3E68DRAFT_431732 [Trichoderma sp. SZMC 28012]
MPLLRKLSVKGEILPKEILAVLPKVTEPWTVGFDGAIMNGLQTLPQWRGYFNSPSATFLGVMNALFPIGKIFAIFLTT